MERKIEDFTIEFFKNHGCNIEKQNDIYKITNIQEELAKNLGIQTGEIHLTFKQGMQGAQHLTKESSLFSNMTKYLQNSGKTTLLKIDFEVDALKKIQSAISLNNCEISNLTKKDRNSFFSRFTFMSSFRYLNETEKIMKEVYVHEGNVVQGDLTGYRVIEGKSSEAKADNLERDYIVAKDHLKAFLETKTGEISDKLTSKLEGEIERIKEHYTNLIKELGGDLNEQLDKIRELEIQLRTGTEDEKEQIRPKIERLRKNIIKVGDDEAKTKILKEQEFTIRDAIQKYSLNIDNTLINTTLIYYPVYGFNLFIKRGEAGRFLDMVYDPLLDKVQSITCESCGKKINKLNLCSSGHLSCDTCLGNCDGCGTIICEKCYQKPCTSCARRSCKSCIQVCRGCGAYACKDHLRKDGVTGEQRCLNCLRPCLRCHSLTEPKYFGEAIDGSKVCQKCLGTERRQGAMKEIFRRD